MISNMNVYLMIQDNSFIMDVAKLKKKLIKTQKSQYYIYFYKIKNKMLCLQHLCFNDM